MLNGKKLRDEWLETRLVLSDLFRVFAEHPACTDPVLETRSNNKTQGSTRLSCMELTALHQLVGCSEAVVMSLPAGPLASCSLGLAGDRVWLRPS